MTYPIQLQKFKQNKILIRNQFAIAIKEKDLIPEDLVYFVAQYLSTRTNIEHFINIKDKKGRTAMDLNRIRNEEIYFFLKSCDRIKDPLNLLKFYESFLF